MQTTTLEHFTNYKASELKPVVLALEDLQLNTKVCTLHAIREKYKQEKVRITNSYSLRPILYKKKITFIKKTKT